MPTFIDRKRKSRISALPVMGVASAPSIPNEKPLLRYPYTSFDAIDRALLWVAVYKIGFSFFHFYSWSDIFSEFLVGIPFFIKPIAKKQAIQSDCFFLLCLCFFVHYVADFFVLDKRKEGCILSIAMEFNLFGLLLLNQRDAFEKVFFKEKIEKNSSVDLDFSTIKKMICRDAMISSIYTVKLFLSQVRLTFSIASFTAFAFAIQDQAIFFSIGGALLFLVEKKIEKAFKLYHEKNMSCFLRKINDELSHLYCFHIFVNQKDFQVNLLSTINDLMMPKTKKFFQSISHEKNEFFDKIKQPILSVTFQPIYSKSISTEAIISVANEMGFDYFFCNENNERILLINFLTDENCTEDCANYFCHRVLSKIDLQKKIENDLDRIQKNLDHFISYRIVNHELQYLFIDEGNVCRSLVNYFEDVTYDPKEKIYVASLLRDEPLLSPSFSERFVLEKNLFSEIASSNLMMTDIGNTIKRTGRKIHEVTQQFNKKLSFFSSPVPKTYQWKNYFHDQLISEDKVPSNLVFWRNRSAISSRDQLACVYWDAKKFGEHFPKGSDEALLYAAFNTQSKNGLRSLGQRGDGMRIYELRAQCEKRILGIEIQEPGEMPLIFLTSICNHSGLQKAISTFRHDEIKAYAKAVLCAASQETLHAA